MKAVLWTKYGSPDGLQLSEVDKPVPGANELLIQVYATTVTTGDVTLRSFNLKNLSVFSIPMRIYIGLLKPNRIKILGQELAGEVEAVGSEVRDFEPGDQVFAATGFHLSAHAEYICLPEDSMVALKPANMTYEEAAAIPLGGLEAWNYLKQANLQKGQTILINGAGGSIGTLAVQLAKHFGAEVTAVDSAEKLDMLRSIGADHVMDYRQEDFSRSGLKYDVIFDVIGSSSAARSQPALQPDGLFLSANPGLAAQLRGLLHLVTQRKKVVSEYTGRRNEDLLRVKAFIEAGALHAVIDGPYPLEQMAEAHRYVESGHKKGNVVVTL